MKKQCGLSTIKKIKDENGDEKSKWEEIAGIVKGHFQNIFSSEGERNMDHVLAALECRVTDEMNEEIAKPFTEKEVVHAIKQMHPTKAPGPDEALMALIKQAERNGNIHGVRITRNALVVSHLFFANDTILFIRANEKEADAVKQILQNYETASGQRISLDKTEITCNSNISLDRLGLDLLQTLRKIIMSSTTKKIK